MTESDQVDGRQQAPALGTNTADRIAAIGRGLAGAVPFAGGAIAEIITSIIPNQRIDRLEEYLRFLAEEVERLKNSGAVIDFQLPENIHLIEEGAYQAARSLSVKRRQYIAHCVAEGMTAEEKAKSSERRMLELLGQLDDEDIIVLSAFASNKFGRLQDIRPEHPTLASPPRVREEFQLFEASIEKLVRLKLVYFRVRVNREMGIPEFDSFTGEPKGSHDISALGSAILQRTGLLANKVDTPAEADGEI